MKRAGYNEDTLRAMIVDAIQEKKGSINAAAKSLGVTPNALTYWQDQLKIVVKVVVE